MFQLVVLVLDDPALLDRVLDAWLDAGVCGLTVLDSTGVEGSRGRAGGGPGLPGCQRLLTRGGAVVELGPIDGCTVGPGDRLIVETPGGGGLERRADPAQLSGYRAQPCRRPSCP